MALSISSSKKSFGCYTGSIRFSDSMVLSISSSKNLSDKEQPLRTVVAPVQEVFCLSDIVFCRQKILWTMSSNVFEMLLLGTVICACIHDKYIIL